MRWYWIDRYTEFVRGKRAKAIKNISLAEEHMHDHFTNFPVMPHALVVEGVAQTGGLLVAEANECREQVVLAKLVKAVFHCEAYPGDTLTYEIEVENINANGASISAKSYNGDQLHGEFEMMFAYLRSDMWDKELFTVSEWRHLLQCFRVYEVGVDENGNRIEEPPCFKALDEVK